MGAKTFLKEFAYALRRLRKARGFSFTAILTLAFGIGASTAVFTIVDSVILKPLSYRDSGQLVAAWEHVRFLGPDREGPNPRHFDLWQQRATAFSGSAMVQYGATGLALGAEHPQLVGTVVCYSNLFDVLQVTPLLGRTFRPEDGVPGRDNVAILSYPLWQALFSGHANVIGKTIRLGDNQREVIGVLPANFHFPKANALRSFASSPSAGKPLEPEAFVPAALDLNGFSWDGEYGNWVALARLKPGASIAQAGAQLNQIEAQILQEPAYNGDRRPGALAASVQPMQDAVVGDSKTALWLLLAAVMALMLIACVNLANAQLGRAVLRDREAAVRSALGASKPQLIWSSLAESLVLAAIGGAAGVLVASNALNIFRRYSPVDLPRSVEVHLDLSVLVFALAVTFGSSILFGILPALRFLRASPHAALQQNNGRTLGSPQSRRLRNGLIGAQVFGCTALLLITGLFAKSLLRLLHQDIGFETGHVVLAEVRLSRSLYAANASRVAFIDGVLNSLRDIPGVESAGSVSSMPLEGETWIESLTRPDKPEQETLINLRWVSPGYFEAMHERLVAGRFFEERDRNLSNAVLSQSLVKALWKNENPLGGQIVVEGRKFNVIGVVADSHSTSLKTAPAQMAYVHYADRPPYLSLFTVRGMQPADELTSAVRDAIWKFAASITIARVKTLDSQVSDSLGAERLQTGILTVFGIAALLLALLGIYGVLNYSVAGRMQEIAVRMALGANRREMYSLILGETGMPVLAGLAAGLACGAVAGRMVQKLLYDVPAVDAPVSAAVAALFLVTAFAAAFIPARRAASVDPMDALRNE